MKPLSQIRLYHLLLAALVIAAYFTGDEENGIHRLIGYGVAFVVAGRLIVALMAGGPWGWRRFIPPIHAPNALRDVRHPAISRLLILVILSSVAATATTGVMMDRGSSLANPSFSLGENEGAEGEDDDRPGLAGEREEEGNEFLEELHEIFANLILPLVGLHIAYLLIFRLPLARFMIFWPATKAAPPR